MKWTLAVVLLVSLSAGIVAAYPSANTGRQMVCPRGQTRVRDRCVTTSTSSSSATPQPTPAAIRQQPAPIANSSNSTSCPVGHTMRNNKCTPKQCPVAMALNADGKCACAPGFRLENNRCVNLTALETCRHGYLSKKGNCIPPTPSPRPKVCPENTKLNAAGKCAPVVSAAANAPCPSGQRRNRKGSCIPIVVGQSCGQDLWIGANGECGRTRVNGGCPQGKERNGLGNCVQSRICAAGQVKDPQTGVCMPQRQCKPNQEWKNGQCVDIASNTVGRG